MKRRYFVSFSVPRSEGERFKGYIKQIGLIEFWEGPQNDRALPHMYHTLDADDPKLAALRGLLKREGIKWSERLEHIYCDDELRNFPLLELIVTLESEAGAGLRYGTKYDLSGACPHCGTGACQTSPLMLALLGLPKKALVCSVGRDVILVAEALAQRMRDARVTGVDLRQARFYRNDEPLPWWQMIATYEMPPMSARTHGIITNEVDYVDEDGFVVGALPPCPHCRRDGRYHASDEPHQIIYNRRDVDVQSIPDVVPTWECFGRSVLKHDSEKGVGQSFAQPALLVKPMVFEIFRSMKVKHTEFVPVNIED